MSGLWVLMAVHWIIVFQATGTHANFLLKLWAVGSRSQKGLCRPLNTAGFSNLRHHHLRNCAAWFHVIRNLQTLFLRRHTAPAHVCISVGALLCTLSLSRAPAGCFLESPAVETRASAVLTPRRRRWRRLRKLWRLGRSWRLRQERSSGPGLYVPLGGHLKYGLLFYEFHAGLMVGKVRAGLGVLRRVLVCSWFCGNVHKHRCGRNTGPQKDNNILYDVKGRDDHNQKWGPFIWKLPSLYVSRAEVVGTSGRWGESAGSIGSSQESSSVEAWQLGPADRYLEAPGT